MSRTTFALAVQRAGRLACLCPPAEGEAQALRVSEIAPAALGFGLAVLAQALTTGFLPLAGAQLAPTAAAAALPFVAFLAGAAVATLPAAFLMDGFGRRAAFALGASLGIAGGLVVAVALVKQVFPWLVLGAFWLGLAQGFGLFYRHVAAFAAGLGSRGLAVGLVMAAGVVAALAGPSIATAAERLAFPYTFLGMALAAGAVHVAALAVALLQGSMPLTSASGEIEERHGFAGFWGPTLVGGLAWFGMTALMTGGPLALADCGLGGAAISGFVAWHLMAMYAPGLAVPLLTERIGARGLVLLGLAALAVAGGLMLAGQVAALAAALIIGGIGWSLATAGATLALWRGGQPSRLMVAAHDGVLFLASLLGALTAGLSA